MQDAGEDVSAERLGNMALALKAELPGREAQVLERLEADDAVRPEVQASLRAPFEAAGPRGRNGGGDTRNNRCGACAVLAVDAAAPWRKIWFRNVRSSPMTCSGRRWPHTR